MSGKAVLVEDSYKSLEVLMVSSSVGDGKALSHTQPHNKEDEDLESIYELICKYGSNWLLFIFVDPIHYIVDVC